MDAGEDRIATVFILAVFGGLFARGVGTMISRSGG